MASLGHYEQHVMGMGKIEMAQGARDLVDIKPTSFTKRQSKSSIELKVSWRETLVERVIKSKTIHQEEILVAILTGLRPAEFKDGVRVIVDGNQIKYTIKGAKVKTDGDGKTLQGAYSISNWTASPRQTGQ